jgi:hypothetical protein
MASGGTRAGAGRPAGSQNAELKITIIKEWEQMLREGT